MKVLQLNGPFISKLFTAYSALTCDTVDVFGIHSAFSECTAFFAKYEDCSPHSTRCIILHDALLLPCRFIKSCGTAIYYYCLCKPMHVGKIYYIFSQIGSLLDDTGGRDPNDYTLGGAKVWYPPLL